MRKNTFTSGGSSGALFSQRCIVINNEPKFVSTPSKASITITLAVILSKPRSTPTLPSAAAGRV